MPRNAPKIKVDAAAALGAEIVFVGPASGERMQKAEELAGEQGYAIVPPYNDEFIIAGQGTTGIEIVEDLPDVELVLAPVGGGGLISGVAAAINLSGSAAKVVGVEPELANDAQQSFRSGEIVQLPGERVSSTVAEARIIAEPSGAVTFAAWLFHRDELPASKKTVAIVSGGNLEPQLLAQIVGEEPTPD
jgi:threonine dehydratase